jgi:hypothetical protein
MTPAVEALLDELAPALEQLVVAQVAREVPRAFLHQFHHATYRSLADLKWALWTACEMHEAQMRATVTALGLDPEDLAPFHAEARLLLTHQLHEIEALVRGS